MGGDRGPGTPKPPGEPSTDELLAQDIHDALDRVRVRDSGRGMVKGADTVMAAAEAMVTAMVTMIATTGYHHGYRYYYYCTPGSDRIADAAMSS